MQHMADGRKIKGRDKKMRYIIMCGGQYDKWDKPKHLTQVKGEPLVARTIRLLKENGVADIAISTNNEGFEDFGVPVLHHKNEFRLGLEQDFGDWLDAFYITDSPVCYIMGDVFFSPEAIKTIVETETDSIEFFASAEPLPEGYPKRWAEPFAFKVVDTVLFFGAIERAKRYDREGVFYRKPVSWELWQIIKRTPLNIINYTNYTAINDYTCDIDEPEDIAYFEGVRE